MTGTTVTRERHTVGSATMAELDRAAISTRIRQARKAAGFRNRQEFADVLHVHWRTIEDWENPKHTNVPWDRLDEIGGATSVSRDWLLYGEREGEASALVSIEHHLESLEAQVAESVALTREALELLREARRQEDGAPAPRRRASDDRR